MMNIQTAGLKTALMATVSIAIFGTGSNVAAQEAASATSPANEIVVTARKREEGIQDVPLSLYAVSGEALANAGIADISQLAGNVVGVALQDGGPGYRTLFIRGLGSDRGNAPTTGFYLDETFVTPGGAAQAVIEPLYFDVARVEVLRGPQGTVFGGGSMGGTVRVISNRPNVDHFDWAAGVDVSGTHDGGINYQTNGMANIVLAPGVAALRVAGSYRSRDGYIDQIISPAGYVGPDRTPAGPVTRIKDVNDDQSLTLRAALTVNPTPKLHIEPSIFYQKISAGSFAAMDRPPEARDMRRVVAAPEWLKDEFILGNLVMAYDLGFAELLSSTSVSKRTATYREDISDYVFQNFFASLMTKPLTIGFEADSTEKQTAQELRLVSSASGPFHYIVGAYYENYRRSTGSIVQNPDLASGFPAALRPLVGALYPGGLLFERASGFKREQVALFAEADYDLTSRLNLAVGARYYRFNMNSWIELPSYQKAKSRNDGINPRATLSYKPGENNLLFITAARGFRPGGPNRVFDASERAACGAQYQAAGVGIDPATGLVAPYSPDSVWNYEVGAKTRMFGGRLQVNGAAYAMDWKDIQQLFLPACGRGATQNFGDARIRGVEIEWNANLGSGFSLLGGVNYSNAEIASDIPQLGVRKGIKIQNAPEWTGNATLQYEFAGPAGLDATALFNMRYVDDSYRDFNQSPAAARRFQDGYALLNARLNLKRDNWVLSLYANNLTDAKPGAFNLLSNGGPVPSYDRMVTIEPRTFGIAVTVRR